MLQRDITFLPISGCEGKNSIEPSVYTVNVDGTLFLLDVGYMSTGKRRSEKEERQILRTLEKVKSLEPELAGILVSHAHLDHIGLLAHVFYLLDKVPVYMTTFTRDIGRIILKDAIKVSPAFYGDNLRNIYRQATGHEANGDIIIESMLSSDRIHVCDFDLRSSFQIGEVKIKALRAGHIPGAASFLITGKQNSTILYTGDYSRTAFLTVEEAPDPPSDVTVDAMITESTYGDKSGDFTREEEVNKFISIMRGILSNRGRVLIPSFALGRAQEILAILLKSMKEDGTLQPYPIRILGMARNITYLCTEDTTHEYVKPWTVKNFEELFKYCMYAGCSEGLVQFPASNYEVEKTLIYDNGPGIFIAPSGMLTGGWSPKIASYLAKEPTSAILFVGYQDEESPGRKFIEISKSKALNKTVELKVDPDKPAKPIRFSCLIANYRLSAHANGSEIADFVVKWKPKNVFLVHGPSYYAKSTIESAVHRLLPNTKIEIPKNGKLYSVFA